MFSHLKLSETFEVNTKRCHLHGTGVSRFSRVEGFQWERMGTDGNLPSSTYVEHIFTVFTIQNMVSVLLNVAFPKPG